MKQLSNETAIPPCTFVLFALLLMLIDFSFRNGNLNAQGLWRPEQFTNLISFMTLTIFLGMRCSGSLRI